MEKSVDIDLLVLFFEYPPVSQAFIMLTLKILPTKSKLLHLINSELNGTVSIIRY